MGSTIGGEESRVRSEDVDRDSFSYRNWARKHLYWYMKDVQPLFKQRAKKLKKKGGSEGLLSREKDSLSPKFNGPSAIFCFDEARELLNNPTEIEESDMMFLALRRALRQQTKSAKNQDEKEFFAVLLDTSSKVNAFSPQKELDPSAKWTESDRLFTPIYKIDSMDVFARDTVDGVPKVALKPILKDGDLKSLFSLGRPLWGAMAERMEINDLVDFALSKAYGGIPGGDTIDDVVGLALLSYRLFFYVVSPWLAEKLSSGYLRYIHGISDDWKLLRTVQPSEPILAHISSCETKSPLKRQRLIEALYSNIMQGTIHLGDIGEMVACLVFLFTFDKAATTDLPGPIKFSTFFESLVSHDVFADFKIRMEDDSNMKTILDDGHIFFNHFIRATEEITPETLTLVKNRANSSITDGLKNEALSALDTAASNLGISGPFVGMLMSLRGKQGKETIETIYPPLLPEMKTRQTEKQMETDVSGSKSGSKYNWTSKPSRVILVSIGMNSDVFPGLQFNDSASGVPQAEKKNPGPVNQSSGLHV